MLTAKGTKSPFEHGKTHIADSDKSYFHNFSFHLIDPMNKGDLNAYTIDAL